jgi:class 3 adenylate cyclase
MQRKTVTVLFCDVTGSTALGESIDPEALRAMLARYFERMKAIVESHGGTVEKFIGRCRHGRLRRSYRTRG